MIVQKGGAEERKKALSNYKHDIACLLQGFTGARWNEEPIISPMENILQ